MMTNALALDCEMVLGENGKKLLAQVAIVNENGQCLKNLFVKHSNVVDHLTAITGITPNHLQSGMKYEAVQHQVAEIIRGKLLVGHALKNDLEALGLTHPEEKKRDTAYFFRTEGGFPSLKDLAREHLNLTIHDGAHNAVQDARVTMKIFKKFENQNGWVRESAGGSLGKS